MMNRESKQNRGLLRSNSQIQVANKAGDVIGTNATHTVGNAAKDACNLILADWQAHGPMNSQQGNVQEGPELLLRSRQPFSLRFKLRLQHRLYPLSLRRARLPCPQLETQLPTPPRKKNSERHA